MVSASNIDGAQLETDAIFTACRDSYMQGFTSVTACIIWCKSHRPLPMATAGFILKGHRFMYDVIAGAAVTVRTRRQCKSTTLDA